MKKSYWFFSSFSIIFFLSTSVLFAQSDTQRDVTIGFVADGDWSLFPLFKSSIESEIEKLTRSDFNVKFPADKSLKSNWTQEDIALKIKTLMNDPEVDMVIAIGAISSHISGRLTSYPKPLIATTVLDPILQELPFFEGKSTGIRNFTYVVTPFSGARDAQLFHSIYPYKRLGLILHETLVRNLGIFDEYTEQALDSLDSNYKIITYEHGQHEDFFESIKHDSIDAVLFGPLLLKDVTLSEKQLLIDGINNLKIPSFALLGGRDVQLGVMAGMASPSNFDLVGKRVGLNVFRMLNGKNASELKVTLDTPEELTINMETVRNIDFYPSWTYLSEAVLINEEVTNDSNTLDYYSAIQEALKNNRDLMSADKSVLSADQSIRAASGRWKPQVGLSYSNVLIDEDRAAASFGQQTEFSGNAQINLEQVIFSEQVRAGVDIQKKQKEATLQARNETELNIVLDAGIAYLNLLRAKTAENIQKENLSLTRKNLEFAESRTAVGYSRTTDVYRWENQIALVKRDLLNARANRINAEYQLNSVLFRPVDQPLFVEDLGINDPNLNTNNEVILSLVDNPKDFEILVSFFVELGLKQLPELNRISTQIQIQERLIALNHRQLFLPTFSLQGNYTNRLVDSGAGADAGPIDIPGIGTIGTAVDDEVWSIGISASLPLFTGNIRKANYQQSRVDFENLTLQKQSAEIRFEQLIRSNMQNVRAAFTSIELTAAAAAAARSNYEIVKDSYARGLVSVIRLIDAQNASINSDLLASNAVYEFIIQLMRLERSTGNFYVISTPEQRDEITALLRTYINNQE